MIISVEIVGMVCSCVLDLFAALRGEHEVVSGVALNDSNNSKMPWRTVEILDKETGEKITVMFFSKKVDKGEEITIAYLKHTKFGTLVR